jgi:3-oxoadipate enol-lactonase
MKSISVNGIELWYVDRGAGLPLVLVHGFPFDHTMWSAQIVALAGGANEFLVGEAYWANPPQPGVPAPSCRVIVPDLRGFGRSPVGDDPVTMDQYADDLAALLDGLAIREPVVLCGLSMGGYIAVRFWRKYAARLRGLILCDTRLGSHPPEVAAARREMADRVLREGPAPLVESSLPRLFAESTRRRQPNIIERLRQVMMSGDPRGIAAADRAMADRVDMNPELGQIGCRALVLVGQSDVISTPAEMCAIAAAIPGAQFVEIPAAGHMAPLEKPAEVNAAIAAFLETV